LPPAVAERQIIADLTRYLPDLEESNIDRLDFQPHFDAPLLTNEVGMWSSRPAATTTVPNLFLAGDYCRTHIDLVCMEGAVSAGLLAAEAIRRHVGAPGAIPIRVPASYPRWIWWLAKWAGMPFAAIAKLLLMLKDSGAKRT
jgi:hypothetical protein